MANQNDSFIDEVTEEVRRDKLFALFRKYGWIGVVAVIAIVAGAAWTEWQKARREASAQAFGDQLLAALGSDEQAARLAALDGVAAEDGQDVILALIAAAEAVAAEDSARAVTLLDPIAADATLPRAYRHLALFKKVLIAGGTLPAAERDAALAELAEAGAPFRPLAMEQQALALVEAGEVDAALGLLNQILREPDLTPALRRRATQLIVALGGDIQTG